MQFALQTAKDRFEEEADNIRTKHEENHAGYGGHNEHKFNPKALMLLGLLWRQGGDFFLREDFFLHVFTLPSPL